MPRPFAPVVAPPLPEQHGQTFPRVVELMQRLLAPDGCPWDREQTLDSLRRFVIEEACEVASAIEDGDRKELCAELGDLLFQVVFQAEVARAEGSFGPDDVIAAICDKLVRLLACVVKHLPDAAEIRSAHGCLLPLQKCFDLRDCAFAPRKCATGVLLPILLQRGFRIIQ